jgi:lipopolysaccharide export system permease protein
MKLLPLTFSFYVARAFFFAIMSTLGVILLVVGVIELMELIRRAGEVRHDVPFFVVVEMALLKLPSTAEKIYPFCFLIGGMLALSRLTRSSELVAARAAGVSVWQFMSPGILLALALGVVMVSILNPIGAAMISRFEKIEGRYITGKPSVLSISSSGLWLRQVDDNFADFYGKSVKEYILYARRMDQSSLEMRDVILFFYDQDKRFIGRADADSALLRAGAWQLKHTQLAAPGMTPEPQSVYLLPTNLTLREIQDSFASPETLSFWALPHFIEVLEKAGFSGLRHKLHWHSLFALPVLLAGMLLLAAVFSLRHTRKGQAGWYMVAGIVVGFFYYFSTNLIYALGQSGGLPVMLAAWAPSLIVVMLGAAALLHLEDG